MARQHYAAIMCSGAFLIAGLHGARAQPQCQIVCTFADQKGKPAPAITTCHPNINPTTCAALTQSRAGQFGIRGCTGEIVSECKPGKMPH